MSIKMTFCITTPKWAFLLSCYDQQSWRSGCCESSLCIAALRCFLCSLLSKLLFPSFESMFFRTMRAGDSVCHDHLASLRARRMLSTDSPEADIRASGFVIPAFLSEEVARNAPSETLGMHMRFLRFEGSCSHIGCKLLNVLHAACD
jgi:hypothetical protein